MPAAALRVPYDKVCSMHSLTNGSEESVQVIPLLVWVSVAAPVGPTLPGVRTKLISVLTAAYLLLVWPERLQRQHWFTHCDSRCPLGD
jgi:hypothetical protein